MLKNLFSSFLLIASANFTFAQTNLFNGGTDITVDLGAIVYVDGHIINEVSGFVHNKGDIYLTRDWTNREPSGCLDPTTGTVILDGATTQTITGTQSTTFNNLDCRQGSKKILNINTYVGGSTGVLMLKSSPFDLNSKIVIVTNAAPAAITRTTGYIISESEAPPTGNGYGIVDWKLGNSGAGKNYTYPFGTTTGTYIPFLFNVKTAGVQNGVGSLSVSTYPTSTTANPNNRPLPTNVSNLIDLSVSLDVSNICADRYWITDAFNYNSNPAADIIFTYRDSEWDNSGGSNNLLLEDSLRAWRWSGNQWENPPVGIDNPTMNQVTVTGASFFSQWTLLGDEPLPPPPCGEFFLPNAFSPNADGRNDLFRPRSICIRDINFIIYNRWGNPVFESTDVAKGWDGNTPEGEKANPGVYVYVLKATLNDGSLIDQKGTVTLVK